jgi:microcystin-dependent protein
MSTPFVGEIRMFGGNFAPAGWMFCAGQLLPIAENEVLFTLLGTTYGGDGQSTFALPDLRGRLPVHQGTGPGLGTVVLGETGGVESVTLMTSQMPAHTHGWQASTSVANQSSPEKNVTAQSTAVDLYIEDTATAALAPGSIGSAGGSQPHTNLQPYLCVNFIISLFGLFPQQS